MDEIRRVLAEMNGKTGSATLHFKRGKLMKVEYKYSKQPAKGYDASQEPVNGPRNDEDA